METQDDRLSRILDRVIKLLNQSLHIETFSYEARIWHLPCLL